ncbi:LEAF RUST 10 DISEASE-RESISTANCE LOCUS RECEPTOR-LIKE PROTEIN KINASE-like 2.1 [Prosopis cineraria]|uniref:LEAF RUST 10 DISEASE-RESISTANCE LOCUS RECEPTOR-LIKE PROTEIN KINASE-like 2.1 n=1 Tax=Prosopis cineraria TaxID=364024 RepID=UPI00240FD26F|nr:LEAF RUST 10 DISEASE-RESISTANCE LOCUS RECEPTOR-LIKE PROTEIN KINASE-like 2.1 [Prosopis cineraria]
MGIEKGLMCWNLVWYALLLITQRVISSQDLNNTCAPSRCGIITNISHPFRLPDDPANCGDPRYELACENNVTLLHLYDGKFPVLAINYNNYTIRLVDPGIQADNFSTLPRYFLFRSNFSRKGYKHPYGTSLSSEPTFEHVVYLNCSDLVWKERIRFFRDSLAWREYTDTGVVADANWESEGGHVYAVVGDLKANQFKSGCDVKMVTLITSHWDSLLHMGNFSYADIHRLLSYGFEVSWEERACADLPPCPFSYQDCNFSPETKSLQCTPNRTFIQNLNFCIGPMMEIYEIPCRRLSKLRIFGEDYLHGIRKGIQLLLRRDSSEWDYRSGYNFSLSTPTIELGIVTARVVLPYITAKFLFGIIFLSALLIYTCRRRHLSMYEDIEEFIRLYNLTPIRYSYKELKTMTECFKNKLGEGGFGTVYKGKLRSGPNVAIKMLGKSKANNQEFISEVATIGRIHHFNVVHLVGFCVEGTKQALVYEFMSNGSLDKFIFSKQESDSLSYHKIYEISLGIARGIAYLHHGCNMQILHFDIKPHNILLDDTFTPKISDFGLARLYSVNDSVVTLTAARGTIGYMAPELFYKNIGGVSYKADVYSFGMLLMEMASRRRNLNPHLEHSSQLYFPLWIYDQFDEEKDIEMEGLTQVEKDLTRKMFIVALWCIQLKPIDRPSMNKVIEMLENDVESLAMPPKPSLYPNEIVLMDDGSNSNQTTSTVSVHSHSRPGEGASNGK